MSSLVRRNAGLDMGDWAIVTPVSPHVAQEVSLASTKSLPPLNLSELVKPALLGQALIKDDVIVIPLSGLLLELVAVFTKPDGPVTIASSTNIKMVTNPVRPIDYTITGVTFEDVGGLEEVKQRLKELVVLPIIHPEVFASLRIRPPRGLLLTGPPGCGKTLLAKAVATEARANFFLVNGPEIVNQYVGESERRLREVFEEAEKKAPAIIFIDEIDAIAGKRSDANQYEVRLVSQLLTLMDGFKKRDVVVIAATNRPDALDEALRRPGRFDWEIQVGIPNTDEREKIIETQIRGKPLSEDVNVREIAELTSGYTGADLALLINESALNAVRRMRSEIE
ncbi:MAG: AAA family ATPase, partial [Thermosphaera sp.]